MAIAELRLEPSRDQLSQTIVECLKSWPESHRQVFVEIHYCGRSAEDVARILNLQPAEVVQVLEQCELKLYHALKVFRNGASPEMSEVPPHPHVYPASCCSR
jgi:DNA-directed RNA polymerase specialized sigma24 family protein